MTAAVQPCFPDVDFALDELENIVELMDELRAEGRRIAPVNFGDEIAWIILRHADVAAFYRDDENFPAAAAFRRHSMPTMGKTIQCMEGAEHRVHRKLIAPAFLQRVIAEMVPRLIYPQANALIDDFQHQRKVDLVANYTRLQPLRVICATLGIPSTDNAQLIGWIEGLFSYGSDPESALRARREITNYLTPLIHSRRENPGDDIISLLASATAEGQMLDDEAILSMVRLLFPAGADTTYLASGSMFYHILRDRELYRHLLDHPQDRAAAVEESLRMYGPVYLMLRYTEHGLQLDGVEVPADSWLLYGNVPANYDPDAFPDPKRFDLHRDRSKMLSFATGPHICLGRFLARANMLAMLSVLLNRTENLRLTDADSVKLTGAVLRGPRAMQVSYDAVHSEHSIPETEPAPTEAGS